MNHAVAPTGELIDRCLGGDFLDDGKTVNTDLIFLIFTGILFPILLNRRAFERWNESEF